MNMSFQLPGFELPAIDLQLPTEEKGEQTQALEPRVYHGTDCRLCGAPPPHCNGCCLECQKRFGLPCIELARGFSLVPTSEPILPKEKRKHAVMINRDKAQEAVDIISRLISSNGRTLGSEQHRPGCDADASDATIKGLSNTLKELREIRRRLENLMIGVVGEE